MAVDIRLSTLRKEISNDCANIKLDSSASDSNPPKFSYQDCFKVMYSLQVTILFNILAWESSIKLSWSGNTKFFFHEG